MSASLAKEGCATGGFEKSMWTVTIDGARILLGKTGVTADRDKIEFRLFNSNLIFNINLREELFSLLKQNQTMHPYPGFMALVT